MKKFLVSLIVFLFFMSFTGQLFAAGTADEAKAMVGKAAAFMKANGRLRTLGLHDLWRRALHCGPSRIASLLNMQLQNNGNLSDPLTLPTCTHLDASVTAS